MHPESAQTIALHALRHILSDEPLARGFVAETGADVEQLRRDAGDPVFLAGVLDFLLSREPDLLAFCDAFELPPTLPERARRALPGGGLAV